ncbi:hypothetical protein GOODEAATRI_032673 [Goodea atripinnis]|uniref:Uncharacterized protein n=1 Tax=Goodea atripinnis TaxID=208336 RepID=A0ABV0PU08_9TELE
MHLYGTRKGKGDPHSSPCRSGVQGPTDATEGSFFSVRRPERHIRGSASRKAFCAQLCPRWAFAAQSRSTERYDRNEPTRDPDEHGQCISMGIVRENVAHISPCRSGVPGPTDATEGSFFSVRRPERHIRGSASRKAFCARLCPRWAFTARSRSTKRYDQNEPTRDPVAHSHPSRSPPNGIANLGRKVDRTSTANVSLWGTVRENLGLPEASVFFILTLLRNLEGG